VSRPPLWIATGNRKKRLELERLLEPLGFELHGLEAAPVPVTIVEDALDFAGNARKKAAALAAAVAAPALGDDSGLCVDALGGRPGVLSARYGGPDATDLERIELLLGELAGVPPPRRTARFVCALCLIDGSGRIVHEVQETCEGSIAAAPSGSHGFGYDPVFVPNETCRGGETPTLAELGAATKDRISHRGKALRRLTALLSHRDAESHGNPEP